MFNVLYIALYSFLCVIFLGKFLIPVFRKWQGKGQPIRVAKGKNEVAVDHSAKVGTPTAGGVFLLVSLLSSVLFASMFLEGVLTKEALVVISVTVSFFAIGFIDDYFKVKKVVIKGKVSDYGLSGKIRLLLEFLTAMFAVYFLQGLFPDFWKSVVYIPLLDFKLDLGLFYLPFASFVIVGTANAVNITDGLDGLVTKLSLPVFAVIFMISVASSISGYYIGASELIFFPIIMFGALLGFLWFNSKPASIFMGDCGSLMIGGLMGVLAVAMKIEILFAILAGVFVIETVTNIMQIYYFKLTGGKRIFKMCPIHHHFEKCGWSEEKIVERFFIVGTLFAILSVILFYAR